MSAPNRARVGGARRATLRLVVGATGFVLALAIGGAVSGQGFAFAASPGGTPPSFRVSDETTSSCQATGLSVTYPAPSFTNGTGYTVGSVNVAGLNATACGGRTLSVTLADGQGNAIASGSALISGAGTLVSVTVSLSTPVPASEVGHTHLAIG